MRHHLWKALLLAATVESFIPKQMIERKRIIINGEEAMNLDSNRATSTILRQSTSNDVDHVDIAIVGAGIGGLCAGAILNTLYGKKIGVYESHYLPGGCAHAFDRKAPNGKTFTFDSGPTILLGYVLAGNIHYISLKAKHKCSFVLPLAMSDAPNNPLVRFDKYSMQSNKT